MENKEKEVVQQEIFATIKPIVAKKVIKTMARSSAIVDQNKQSDSINKNSN